MKFYIVGERKRHYHRIAIKENTAGFSGVAEINVKCVMIVNLTSASQV